MLGWAVLAAALAALMFALTCWNARVLRRPVGPPNPVREPVSILVPARNEERAVRQVVAALLAQSGLEDFEVIVLDDGSTDATAQLLDAFTAERLRVITGGHEPLPEGWLGKPWACHRLALAARGQVLVFVDADVILRPHAVAAAVTELRTGGLQLLSPFPRQLTGSPLEWLLQPWLTWLWLATLPLWWAERSHRPELSAANGQFLVVDAPAYRAAGGHAAVRSEVIDDINLMRVIRAAGGRAVPADGSRLADCRMYQGGRELVAGYAKSLWQAFGGPFGSSVAVFLLLLTNVFPWFAVLRPELRWIALTAIALSLGSRLVAAFATGADPRSAPLQPLAALTFAWLNVVSWSRHLRGANQWKGRSL